MMSGSDASRVLIGGLVVGFVLLIAAVWASGPSLAAGLAATAGLILFATAALAALVGPREEADRSAEQRHRMGQDTP